MRSSFSLRGPLGPSLITVLAWVCLATPPAAQVQAGDPCTLLLAEAEARYYAQDYTAVEPLVASCVHRREADAAEVTRGYRLLALAFIKQDLLAEAQVTIVKLLGANIRYEPDPVQDLPLYVALVTAVKDQLRVVDTLPAVTQAGGVAGAEGSTLTGGTAGVPRRVDVNLASASVLETLDGIGPVLAARIIEYRETFGPFRSVQELLEVKGIGPRTLERLTPHVTVDGPATAAGGAAGLTATPPIAPPARPASPPPGGQVALLVNLNTASARELEQIRGIGAVLAERIVAYREAMGHFRSTEAVMEVQGIGPGTYERIAPYITVGEPLTSGGD
jgi:competence protein ComEA